MKLCEAINNGVKKLIRSLSKLNSYPRTLESIGILTGERGDILEQRKCLMSVLGKPCGWPRPREGHQRPGRS